MPSPSSVVLQSLWGGYGEIVRTHVAGHDEPVIVKSVKPPPRAHERAISHARKSRSYDVELAFYKHFAPRCDDTCRVARLIDHQKNKDGLKIVLEDLDSAGFPTRHHDPVGSELDACLAWLASFHARFMGVSPEGLWKIGTYWHLDTRRDELANIRDASLRERADEIDRMLRQARFQTIVHGDAKPDNFCFSRDGTRVAAVDFQYVGGGCGIQDVAYLLHGSSASIEARSLSFYFSELRKRVDDDALEREWRGLYAIACDDFRRFLAGWRV